MALRFAFVALVSFLAGVLLMRWLGEPAAVVAVPADAAAPAAKSGLPGAAAVGSSIERLEAAAEPRAEVAAPAAEQAREAAEPLERVVVFGEVTEADGTAVLGGFARVRFVDDQGQEYTANAEGGCYAFARLTPGTWRAKCSANGYESVERAIELAPDGPATVQEDFVLARKWTVHVCVRDAAGGELEAAVEAQGGWRGAYLSAMATRDHPGEKLEPTNLRHHHTSDVARYEGRIGHFPATFEGVPAECIGTLTMEVGPPVWVSVLVRDHVIDTRFVTTAVERVDFALDASTLANMSAGLRLRVVDLASGEPVTSGSVHVGHRQQTRFLQLAEDGTLVVEELPPGKVLISVRAAGYALRKLEFDLEPGRVTDLGALELEAPHSISGRVLRPDGERLETDLSLFHHVPGDLTATLNSAQGMRHRTDPDGTFRIEGIAAGEYVLLAGSASSRDPVEQAVLPVFVDLRAGSLEGLELRAAQTARLILRPAEDAVGLKFRIATPDGLPVKYGTFRDGAPVGYDLVPGAYRLVLRRGSEDLRARALTLAPQGSSLDVSP